MILDKRKLLASQSQFTPLIDQLILIDRSVDLMTPLLTQLTYEGLVDAMFNIENSNYVVCCFLHTNCVTHCTKNKVFHQGFLQ